MGTTGEPSPPAPAIAKDDKEGQVRARMTQGPPVPAMSSPLRHMRVGRASRPDVTYDGPACGWVEGSFRVSFSWRPPVLGSNLVLPWEQLQMIANTCGWEVADSRALLQCLRAKSSWELLNINEVKGEGRAWGQAAF